MPPGNLMPNSSPDNLIPEMPPNDLMPDVPPGNLRNLFDSNYATPNSKIVTVH